MSLGHLPKWLLWRALLPERRRLPGALKRRLQLLARRCILQATRCWAMTPLPLQWLRTKKLSLQASRYQWQLLLALRLGERRPCAATSGGLLHLQRWFCPLGLWLELPSWTGHRRKLLRLQGLWHARPWSSMGCLIKWLAMLVLLRPWLPTQLRLVWEGCRW